MLNYYVLINMCITLKRTEEANFLFNLMKEQDIVPDQKIYNIMLNMYINNVRHETKC